MSAKTAKPLAEQWLKDAQGERVTIRLTSGHVVVGRLERFDHQVLELESGELVSRSALAVVAKPK